MAPQLATVDVALNAFYGIPMLSPTTRSIPEDNSQDPYVLPCAQSCYKQTFDWNVILRC